MCAKVTGPLYSMSASGTIGKAMVHFTWKGINVVREWLIPKNSKTADQGDVRLVLGGCGQATRCVGLADATHNDSLFGADAKLCSPSGQTWTSYLVQYLIKNVMPDATTYEAIYTAFEAHAQKAQFTTDAGLLELADFDIAYKGTAHLFSKGMQLYCLGLYGIAMRVLKEGVFNRVPFTVAIDSWTSENVDSLKADLLQQSL